MMDEEHKAPEPSSEQYISVLRQEITRLRGELGEVRDLNVRLIALFNDAVIENSLLKGQLHVEEDQEQQEN